MRLDYSIKNPKHNTNEYYVKQADSRLNSVFGDRDMSPSEDHISGDYEVYRSIPLRPAELQADVLVPAAQAAISALVVALPTASLVRWLDYSWYSPLFVGCVAMSLAWFRALSKLAEERIKVENVVVYADAGRGRTRPGRTPAEGIRLQVNHIGDEGFNRVSFCEVPDGVSVEKFSEFCAGVVGGKGLARTEWVGKGKVFSRGQYDQIMGSLETNGIIRRGDRGERILTRKGAITLSAADRFVDI